MPGEPAVSVVIACRDAAAVLPEQLEALAGQDLPEPWEVVVVDHGSTDGTADVAASYADRLDLRVVPFTGRRGAAAARNAGVAAARGVRVLFCDADDVVAPGWLAAMSGALARTPVVAAVLEHERLNPGWSAALRRSQPGPEPGLLETDPPFLPYAFAAALGVRREAHDAVGGFDESLDRACEDRDYCYRLQLAGFGLGAAPGAVVHYRHRASDREIYRQARAYGEGNVRMYRDYRDRGLGRPSNAAALVSWLLTPVALLRSLPTRAGRARFAARTGWRVGRLRGSLRYRTLSL